MFRRGECSPAPSWRCKQPSPYPPRDRSPRDPASAAAARLPPNPHPPAPPLAPPVQPQPRLDIPEHLCYNAGQRIAIQRYERAPGVSLLLPLTTTQRFLPNPRLPNPIDDCISKKIANHQLSILRPSSNRPLPTACLRIAIIASREKDPDARMVARWHSFQRA